ncbi:RNA polymerase factor sigma-54, partial [Acinetobacter baumannii]|nr:RNA polymerase factor sigma-54 [Acinetobacter baumannii]
QTLEEHLLEQIEFSFSDKRETSIAKYIIGLLDEAGYLRTSLSEISVLLNENIEDIEKILLKIQTLEPTGIGARNLPECLSLQAK